MFLVFILFFLRRGVSRGERGGESERESDDDKTRKKLSFPRNTHHRDHGPARVDSDAAGLDAADEPRGLDLEGVGKEGEKEVS